MKPLLRDLNVFSILTKLIEPLKILAARAGMLPVRAALVSTVLFTLSTFMAFGQDDIERDHEAARQELAEVREKIQQERLPLSQTMAEMELELAELRESARLARMDSESRRIRLTDSKAKLEQTERYTAKLTSNVKSYTGNRAAFLFPSERVREWQSEQQGAEAVSHIEEGLTRLERLMGGGVLEGDAVVKGGELRSGVFYVMGPAIWFKSTDSVHQGAITFSPGEGRAQIVESAVDQALFEGKEANVLLDVTQGKARALAELKQGPKDLLNHGGLWGWVILAVAIVSSVCALIKLLQLLKIQTPKSTWMSEILEKVRAGDVEQARELAGVPSHPASAVVHSALAYLESGADVVEEVVYEELITVEKTMQSWLSFIAISAAIAPLLGLLGTVSGMIRTFNVITVAGTGDAKPLAGGISEALVTTLFGLVVAIPALLLHSLLSRRSTGIVQMSEKFGLALVNGLRKKGGGK